MDSPSDFYTGLVADLYEPLAGERARADDYAPFLDFAGTPALELACGTGRPMLDLVAMGYAVEGLDASVDMLDRCRAQAEARGLGVVLHCGEMQSFALERRYRSIFLAGASFTLLIGDDVAAAALARIHAHLVPGGVALIPLEIEDAESQRGAIGRTREATGPAGEQLRVTLLEAEAIDDGRTLRRRLRYERVSPGGAAEVLERDWLTRWWSQDQFVRMLTDAGFDDVRLVAPGGGAADPGADTFVALAARPRQD